MDGKQPKNKTGIPRAVRGKTTANRKDKSNHENEAPAGLQSSKTDTTITTSKKPTSKLIRSKSDIPLQSLPAVCEKPPIGTNRKDKLNHDNEPTGTESDTSNSDCKMGPDSTTAKTKSKKTASKLVRSNSDIPIGSIPLHEKPPLAIKGPFNPDIIAKFNDGHGHNRRGRALNRNHDTCQFNKRSASETRKDVKCSGSYGMSEGVWKQQFEKIEKEQHVLHEDLKQKENEIKSLVDEKTVLTGKVDNFNSKIEQYEGILRSMKIDPSSLDKIKLDQQRIEKERSEAVELAKKLKVDLLAGIDIANSINVGIKEIMQC